MPKAGAYFLYMVEFKKREEQRLGRSLSMAEVSQMASNSWNGMSEDEKAYYKEKSKSGDTRIGRRPGGDGSVNGDSNQRPGLLTSQGVPVSLYDSEQIEKKKEIENMRRRIDHMIRSIPLEKEFVNRPLYFMYGNYFYKNREAKYAPAELALIKFNLSDGILARYHTLLNPGSVEMGFAYAVKSHSEETHRLPTPPKAHGQTDFDRVLYEIKKFMRGYPSFDSGNPIIFTYTNPYANEEDQIEVLKSFMQQFGADESFQLDFYPLTRLFYKLRREVVELGLRGHDFQVPNENYCHAFLSRDPYESSAGISCEVHEQADATRFCALSRVCRWTFLLADHFCEPLNVMLVRGYHMPKNADLSDSDFSLPSDTESESKTKSGSASSVAKQQPDDLMGERFKFLNIKNIRTSKSTLEDGIQSIQTGSSASNPNSEGTKSRRSRASLLRANNNETQSTVTSSTFYNSQ